jgi:hypothetical protein
MLGGLSNISLDYHQIMRQNDGILLNVNNLLF